MLRLGTILPPPASLGRKERGDPTLDTRAAGAEERTRTFTRLPGLAPEASASANSATSAQKGSFHEGRNIYLYSSSPVAVHWRPGAATSRLVRRRTCRALAADVVPAEDGPHAVDRQRLNGRAATRHRGRLEQRVVDGLLGRLERRLEQRRHAVGGQDRALTWRRVAEASCAAPVRSRTRSRSRRCRCCRTSRCAPGRIPRAPPAASDRAHRAARRSRPRSCRSRRRDRLPAACRPAL